MRSRRYRRIKSTPNCKLQSYQLSLIALVFTLGLTGLLLYIRYSIDLLKPYLAKPLLFSAAIDLITSLCLIYTWSQREEVSIIPIPTMSRQSMKLAQKLKRLFNDKQITDILKLSNSTRYGNEMPEVYVFVDDNLSEGYVAIENIANWERADREKFEQRVSGVLAGKYQRFAIVNSELSAGDSYIIFYFEDTLNSQHLYIKKDMDSLKDFSSEDKHSLRLSKDLIWRSDIVPHMSIIARTRAGKSVLAGRYMARLMLLQGWTVEYNSAKFDRYVKEFNGQSDPIKIVERAEYWCTVMDKRLATINIAGKEKYLEMRDMSDIGLFFDELGNLNASLESLDKVDKSLKLTSRWTTAINRLSATGGSAGIHIIAISQFATKEGFLPSLARVNCSDAVIMLGGAADSADERKYLIAGFADMPKRSYGVGQGVARILGSGKKWEVPHFYETPWFED
ncbi:cell division protein FtsK [Streptococcus suis]|uniref:Cell division protein FtsK n=1 Tax=Streptococcus suis TaxID=1307 RepID=A0A4T2H4Z9_STRSU|nr:cell division protein FtsK [Streptococcus suis]MBY4633685.1 cell division protein FtsK [Streptococcus suis]TII07173.1 cell division protein FtsK [Streptococcus suis]